MLKRMLSLRLSLAVKCQLLFGAAVLLIIAAALFVPWQRMEQLTSQLNERSAAMLVREVKSAHVLAASQPAMEEILQSRGTTQPTKLATGDAYLAPRLISAATLSAAQGTTRFEQSAYTRFLKDSDKAFHASEYPIRDGGGRGYRYAEPLYGTADCLACHAADDSIAALSTRPATSRPTLLGIASIDIPSQVDDRGLLLNRIFILTAGALAGSLAIVVLYLVTTRLILEPVHVLQETAEKVSDGDLNIRSDINSGDEFQQLSETFNTMLMNLKQSADQLRSVNKSLDLKLGQLAESNIALFESNRLKSEFLANVSHELRTPLNSILGFAELLRDNVKAAGDSKPTRYIQNILNSGGNLLALINDLLDLAKIEAGKMDVRAEQISMTDLFEGLASLLKPLLERKRLELVPSVESDFPIVQTDPAKFQQILYNFLSNAIKFSPEGKAIMLKAERVDERFVRISVRDEGPGVPADKLHLIFEKFRQIDGSATRQHGGTGLGLAISKELTTLLQGTIQVESVDGTGATFSVTIPLQIESGVQDVRGRLVLN